MKKILFFCLFISMFFSVTLYGETGFWTTVGSAGFSVGGTDYQSLAIDSSGVPYVAFRDYANSYKTTVMKFNGKSWETVGSAEFSAGVANDQSLAIDSSGVPYVAYKDYGNGEKTTVMKYGVAQTITATDSEVGSNCDAYGNGGIRIKMGLDDGMPSGIAFNNILEEGEIDSATYVCNGADGSDGEDGTNGENGKESLVKISDEPVGENCETGGKRIDTGIDDNNNGTLDDEEIDNTDFICNGAEGSDGEDGTDGSDGTDGIDGTDGADGEDGVKGDSGSNSLVSVEEEPEGDNCETGGKKIVTGLDLDSSGTLEESEITDTSYVCNGVDGTKGGSGCSIMTVENSPALADIYVGFVSFITGILNFLY